MIKNLHRLDLLKEFPKYDYGNPRGNRDTTMKLEERFWNKVDKSAGPKECWLWTGDAACRYARFRDINGQKVSARRFSYELAYGSIPNGVNIMVDCNPTCVHPEHLYLTTNSGKLRKRFFAKIHKTDGCWIWMGCKVKFGYGKFNVHGEIVLAHRFAYELAHGPIPEGLLVCHNCPGRDNPSCVRPDHLFLGTDKDNMLDAVAKERTAKGIRNGARTHPRKLTAENAEVIRVIYKLGHVTQNTLAKRFNVTPQHISCIVNYKTWR